MEIRKAKSMLAGKAITGSVSAHLNIEGREYVNFFGAGYLALSGVEEIRGAVRRHLAEGAPFSQQLPSSLGVSASVFEVAEHRAARALRTEAAVYFASGCLIGPVALASLDLLESALLLDEHAHYNLRDAAKVSGLQTLSFRHRDLQSLSDSLMNVAKASRRPVILTDGVFAGTGELAPLADYMKLLAPYGGRLVVDESHSFGVVGDSGGGAWDYWNVDRDITIGATLSKAFCAHGAVLGCTASVGEQLRARPPLSGTCAGSPLSAVAAAAALEFVAERPEILRDLKHLTQYLRKRLRALGYDVSDSPAPIVSFKHGGFQDMEALQQRAFGQGVYVPHSIYLGSGAEGVMRCAVFGDHTESDIDILINVLK